MHRNITVRLFGTLLLLGLWAGSAPLARAHDGTARVQLNAERISPGADLEVRGINIAPEMQIKLALVGGGAEFLLGVVVGDAHGDFVLAVAVPREAAAGAYTVRAFGTNRVIVAAPLIIVGAAVEEEGTQRDQDEPLLAPMPRAQPASPAVAAMPAVAAAPAAPQERQITLWPAIALMGLAAAAGLAIVARKHASSAVK
jgi:hypothetical protein